MRRAGIPVLAVCVVLGTFGLASGQGFGGNYAYELAINYIIYGLTH